MNHRPASLVAASLGILLAGVVAAPGASSAAPVCGPAPGGEVAVIVIVDAPGGLSSRCATVRAGATGADALIATGHSLRNQGAFVCAIDSQPADGCAMGDPTAPYWSYWSATPGGSWTYSRVGAFGRHLPERCAVEGWRLVDPGLPRSQAAPRSPVPAVTCMAAPTTTVRPADAKPPVTAAGVPRVPGPAAVAQGGDGAVTPRGLSPGSTASGPEPAPGSSDPTVAPSEGRGPAEVAGETTSVVGPSESAAASVADDNGSADGNGNADRGGAEPSRGQRRAVALAGGSGSAGGSPWPAMGVAAVLVLVAGTVLWRRRAPGACEGTDDGAA